MERFLRGGTPAIADRFLRVDSRALIECVVGVCRDCGETPVQTETRARLTKCMRHYCVY